MLNERIKKLAESYAESCMHEAEALLKELGRIPAPSHQEDKRAAFIRDWLLDHGATDVSIDAAKNVVCRINYTDDCDLVVFQAHTDVVFPDTEPLPMRQEGRILHCPGIGDDTSNLVNLLMSADYILKNGIAPKTGLLIVANSCEEGLGNLDGTKEIMRVYGSRVKKFYSFDGYMSQCCDKAVGSYRYKVSVHVKGGHSWLNFGEPNAIQILSAIVGDLYKVTAPEQTTYNVGRIEGGSTVNSLAQDCWMLYEFRAIEQKNLLAMEREFNAVIDAHRGEGEITVDLLGVRPGNGPIDARALAAYTANSAEVISAFYDGAIDRDAYSTDANVPLSQGILANTIGTVKGALAHTREEWVDLDSLPAGLKIALSLLLQNCEL